jgi:hypothetical protein
MSRLLLPIAVLLAACNRPPQYGPRYVLEIFAEDTVPIHVTVAAKDGMYADLNGAGFFMLKGQPVVLTPASLVIRGAGSATITATDTTQRFAAVPAGTPLDSVETAALLGRVLKVTRGQGQPDFKVEIAKP